MAGIDKTYVYPTEYLSYVKFVEDNKKKMKKDLGYVIKLYKYNSEQLKIYENLGREIPVWNTTPKEDAWLIEHCNIKSYQDRMIEVYDDYFIKKREK